MMVDMAKGMGTTGDCEYMTPAWAVDTLEMEFGTFDLDPCGKVESNATQRCKNAFIYPEKDGLKEKWFGNVYVNPPYGRDIGIWFNKAMNECKQGNCEMAVFLVAARSDTKWWHEYAMKAHEICYLQGRVGFEHLTKKTSSPAFPSVLIIFRRGNRQWGNPLITSLNIRGLKKPPKREKVRLEDLPQSEKEKVQKALRRFSKREANGTKPRKITT